MTSARELLQKLGRRAARIPESAAAPVPAAGPGPPVRGRVVSRRLARGQVMSASVAGGQPPARPDQVLEVTPAGVAPGTASGVFKGRQVIVFGTGPGSGIFVYAGPPAAGNPPVLSIVAPGVSADPYGNPIAPVLEVGTFGGPGLLVDQFGNLTSAAADGSLIEISPQANLPFAVTSALSGVMEGLQSFSSSDGAQTQAGVLAEVLIGSGSATKEALLIGSPFAAQGSALLLQAQNDAGTDSPFATVGTLSTQGDTLTFQPVAAFSPTAFVVYGTGSGTVTVVTKTSGSGTIPIPVGVTVGKGECWGTGGSTSGQSGGQSAIGGSGSGGYSQEPALALTPGGTASYVIPVSASPGSDVTLTGAAVTVTAHPGQAGTINGFGNGAPASGNTIARAGSRGGNPSFAHPGGGGGGGGSPGPGGAGGTGSAGSPTAGGAGGPAGSGGAAGGKGGTPTGNGVVGGAPGAGGGGGSTLASGAIGGRGQVRLTYTSGAPPVVYSSAPSQTADQFGTTIPAGVVYVRDGNTYRAGALQTTVIAAVPINSTSPVVVLTTPTVQPGVYFVRGSLVGAQGSTAAQQAIQFGGSATYTLNIPVLAGGESSTPQVNTCIDHTRRGSTSVAGLTNCGWMFAGWINVTVAGTINIAFTQVTAGASYTIEPLGHLILEPNF